MKLALTGSGGFVAARIIESFLLEGGPSVAAVARHPADFTAAARFSIDLRIADFLDADSLARSFAGCSAVVYTSPLAAPEMKRGTSALCRAAARAGARRIVFLSSAFVHGLCPSGGTDEKSPLPSTQPDAAHEGLVAAERQFSADCREFGLTGHVLRPGLLYGPRSPVIAALATALLAGRPSPMQHADGICNNLCVDNLVAALRLTLKTKAPSGSVFLLADAETVTWREFFYAVAQGLNVSVGDAAPSDEHSFSGRFAPDSAGIEANATLEQFPRSGPPQPTIAMLARQPCTWRLPLARATKELGYQPIVTFAEGMRRSCAWWHFAQGELFTAA